MWTSTGSVPTVSSCAMVGDWERPGLDTAALLRAAGISQTLEDPDARLEAGRPIRVLGAGGVSLHRVAAALLRAHFVVLFLAAWACRAAGAEQSAIERPPAYAARIDSAIEAGMRRSRIPGAAVALVRNGRVEFLRGYGHADVEATRRVDPESTMFGLASTTKTFTALAALIAESRGLLTLDTPVTEYIERGSPLRDRATGVTLGQLLVHTGGYEDHAIGAAARDPAALLPLDRYLARTLPPPAREPGRLTAYSNLGYALAGHVIERAARVPLAEWIDREIVQPLGLTRTSLVQPLPPALEASRAVAVTSEGGAARPVPRIYFNDAPASAMFSSAGDMGRFLAVLMDPASPLSRDAIARLFATRHRNAPGVPGLTPGFRESGKSEERVLESGGDWQDYSNGVWLVPTRRLAVFVAFSGPGGTTTAAQMWRVVREAESIGDAPAAVDVTGSGPQIVPGIYRSTRHSRTTVAALGILTGRVRELSVEVRGDVVKIGGMPAHPAPDGSYRRRDGTAVAVVAPSRGAPDALASGSAAHVAYERIPGFDRAGMQATLLVATWLLLALDLIASLSRRPRRGAQATPGGEGGVPLARRVSRLASGLAVAHAALLVGILAATDPWKLQYGMPRLPGLLLAASPLVAAGAAAAVLVTLQAAARNRWRGAAARIALVRVAVLVLLVALLTRWNLIQVPGGPL